MNLEKQRGAQNTIKKLIVDDKEIIDRTHILEYIREFYETLLKNGNKKQKLKFFKGTLIFQNSLKINQNFMRRI